MKAYIIRLKNIKLSKKLSQECIIAAKRFNIKVEEFDAINGLDHKIHFEKLNLRPAKKFKKFRAGVFGCFLSHYYLWLKCFESQEPCIILEHDGYFIKPLPTDILHQFEDILKLDNENPFSLDYERIIAENMSTPVTVKEIEKSDILDNGAGTYSIGAYGYIIKPQAAKKLIDWIAENGFLPADQQLGSNICKIETVTSTVARLHPYYIHESTIKSASLTKNEHLLLEGKKE